MEIDFGLHAEVSTAQLSKRGDLYAGPMKGQLVLALHR
jgi:hypothetical protein